MALDAPSIVRDVRLRLGHPTSLAPATDGEAAEAGRSAVGDDDVAERALDAGRWAAALVRPEIVPGLVRTIDPRDLGTLSPCRVLSDRVRLGGVTATRQTVAGRRRLSGTGVSGASAAFPVYVCAGGRIDLWPRPDDVTLTAEVDVVVPPAELSDLPDVLRSAVVARTAASVAMTERRTAEATALAAEADALLSPLVARRNAVGAQ